MSSPASQLSRLGEGGAPFLLRLQDKPLHFKTQLPLRKAISYILDSLTPGGHT